LRRAGWAFTLSPVRDRETIDSELRLLAAVRRSRSGAPSLVQKVITRRLAVSSP
jgi:hypothetical protein